MRALVVHFVPRREPAPPVLNLGQAPLPATSSTVGGVTEDTAPTPIAVETATAQITTPQLASPPSSVTGLDLGSLHSFPHTTPVHIDLLEDEFACHSDHSFVSALIHNMRSGAHIGYKGPRSAFQARNLSSAYDHVDTVSAYLSNECAAGRWLVYSITRPVLTCAAQALTQSPKSLGEYKLSCTSDPEGHSVNDGINKDNFFLHYVMVDDAVRLISKHGRGCLLAKAGLKHAFRICPVNKADWPLLGIHWRGQYYVDTVLPFGLRSSPYLFNQLADTLNYIAELNYGLKDLLHYLDDFLLVQPAFHPSHAQVQFETLLRVFKRLGIPLAEGPDKICPPSTVLTFLGIEIGTIKDELWLSSTKLREVKCQVTS